MERDLASAFPEREVRLVLIGKTGNGKSSAANTILGSEKCPPKKGMLSGTDKCNLQDANRHGLSIQVTDTPGVCDTYRSKEEIHKQLVKCIASIVPGPHAVLMCLRCDRRFTPEEYTSYEELKCLFGEELKNYMILIFNGLDQAGELKLEDYTREIKELDQLVSDLGSRDRYVAFNNTTSWEDRKRQGDQVLRLVSMVVNANEGRCFRNEHMQRAEVIMNQKTKEGKSLRDVKEDVVEDRDPTLIGKLLNIVTFGIVPDTACTIL